MKTNELRIGNYVHLFEKGLFKVHTISKQVIQVHGELIGGEVFDIASAQPIALTPELLQKCGFKQDGLYNSAQRWMGIFNQPLIYSNGYCTIPNYPLTEIKYLHQLQNLYFALTGEELDIQIK